MNEYMEEIKMTKKSETKWGDQWKQSHEGDIKYR